MRPSYASLCSVSNVFFFSGNVTNFPAVLQTSSTCQWFRLLTVCCQRFTHQPIVFCVVRPTPISLGLAMQAVSLFSSRAAALVARVSRIRRSTLSRACTSLTKSEEKERLLAVYYKFTQKIIEFLWLYLFYFFLFSCLDFRNLESKPTSRLVFDNVCLLFCSSINWLTDFCKAGKRRLSPSAII